MTTQAHKSNSCSVLAPSSDSSSPPAISAATPAARLPTQAEVELGTPPIQEDGSVGWVFYYQGNAGEKRMEWGWHNGAAGRYTHYYEKLGEAYPGTANAGARDSFPEPYIRLTSEVHPVERRRLLTEGE